MARTIIKTILGVMQRYSLEAELRGKARLLEERAYPDSVGPKKIISEFDSLIKSAELYNQQTKGKKIDIEKYRGLYNNFNYNLLLSD